MIKTFLPIALGLVVSMSLSPADDISAPALKPTTSSLPSTPISKDWTVKGRTFHNVTVTKVEADRVQVSYDGGVGTFALVDLTVALQKQFGYNAAAAAKVTLQRQQQQASSDAQMQVVEAQQAKQVKAVQAQEQAQEIATVAKTNAQRSKLQNQLNACMDAIKSDEAQIKAESWGRGGGAARWETQLTNDQARMASLQQSIAGLSQ